MRSEERRVGKECRSWWWTHQAEDGIRDADVTGVQTCALPISSGIAVGMSTSIPPHNLGEVCDALVYMLDNWETLDEIGVTELMQFIKGPDFPTGGVLYSKENEIGRASCRERV